MLQGFKSLPVVVKNLLIINGLFFLATIALTSQGVDLARILGLYYFASPEFSPYQVITHMFMHGGFMHLFFNMYALFMFGKALESAWGPKRFFIYYFVTGLGAAVLHITVNHFHISSLEASMAADEIQTVLDEGHLALANGQNFIDPALAKLNLLYNIPTVGASGAVFGVLLAFGMLFPNTELMLMFLPVPIKAKYFVLMYGGIELFLGIQNNPSDNVAHFAHLGGMLFGYLLIKFWQKNSRTFY